MQVNKDTFAATLDDFLSLLATCEFYAFDEELTGINVPEITESITFSPAESYESKRRAASRYSLIQVGVCLFHRVEGGEAGSARVHYEARPFNFVLFPLHKDDYAQAERSRDVVMSPSAVAFLRRYNMDFQRWVYEGIAVCDAAQEASLQPRIAEVLRPAAPDEAARRSTLILLTDKERQWVDEALAAARELEGRMAAVLGSEGGDVVLLPSHGSRSAKEYLEAHVAAEAPSVTVSARRRGQLYSVTLAYHSPEELARRREQEALQRRRTAVDMLGFRLVFKALAESRKPCVGHNCFADLLFLMASLDAPLPPTLPEWKARAAALFPAVFDTRYIACRTDLFAPGRFPSHYLGGFFDAYGLSSPRVRVTLPLGFQAYSPMSLAGGGGGKVAHEAGYDALMTGTLLLNLLAELGTSVAEQQAAATKERAAAPPCLANRIALFRSLYALRIGQEGQEGQEEFLPESVIDLEHVGGGEVKPHNIESFFAALDRADAVVYAVDEKRSLAVLPKLPPANSSTSTMKRDSELLITAFNERFSRVLRATPFTPPTIRAAPQLLKPTAPTLMRAVRALL